MKFNKILVLTSVLLTASLTSCGATNVVTVKKTANDSEFKGQTLTIYNCDDYISSGSGATTDLISDFEKKYQCTVNYYTYDTNETMYNQFTLQKEGTYDLICTSEYMIQKMVKEGLVEKFDDISVDVPNYDTYASKELRSKLKSMKVTINGKEENLDDYVVGYMWGTLGLIYDSSYKEGIDEDATSWDILWNEKYKDSISIKNSMRDTFVVGLMHHYSKSESFKEIMDAYLSDDATKEDYQRYNQLIQSTFDFNLDGTDKADQENQEKIDNVKQELISLKQNIFGLEVDSGKNDIITGKIKINLAWSGDACYSIETATEETDGKLELHYSVPEDGANIWYDGWTLPKGSNRELAKKFLDYLSSPEAASINMDYIGYTPFIMGDDMYYTAASWYGAGNYLEDEEYSSGDYVMYKNHLYSATDEISYEDSEIDVSPENDTMWQSEEYDETYSYAADDLVEYNGYIYSSLDDDNLNHVPTDEEYWEKEDAYDLTYLFGDTIDVDAIIYPYCSSKNELECQYPDEKTVARCAIMNDFGSYNDKVIIMWGEVKAYTNMTFTYIFLGCVAALIIIIATTTFVRKKLSSRSKRNASLKAKKNN